MKKEYKILALIGSRKGKDSNTLQFCRKSLETMQEKCRDIVIHTEFLTSDVWNVHACLSCGTCFKKGYCVQEQQDGLKTIKEKMLDADCVILASPVYAGMVSGDMKILIDRLSVWLHTMPLIGKTAAVLSTADSNHGDGAISYMRQIIETMGAVTLCQKNVFIYRGTTLFKDLTGIETAAAQVAGWLKDGLEGPVNPTDAQESYFQMQSALYQRFHRFGEKYPAFRIAEEQIWESQGYFKVSSMRELIERKQRRNKYDKDLV